MAYGDDEAWTTLADRNRRWILTELAGGERTLGELTQAMPITQPAVSQHLKVLKQVGLSTTGRREPGGSTGSTRPGLPRCAISSTPSGGGRCPASKTR